MITHPRFVLIADENREVHSTVSKTLSPDGFFVRHATHWVTAMKFARDIPPRVIVLDCSMKHLELGAFFDHVAALRSAPEIILLGEGGEDFGQEVEKYGIDHYLSKPIDYHVLLSVIRAFSEWSPWHARRNCKARLQEASLAMRTASAFRSPEPSYSN